MSIIASVLPNAASAPAIHLLPTCLQHLSCGQEGRAPATPLNPHTHQTLNNKLYMQTLGLDIFNQCFFLIQFYLASNFIFLNLKRSPRPGPL